MLQTQEDSIQSHTHSVTDPGHTHGYNDIYHAGPAPNYGGPPAFGPSGTDFSGDRFDADHPSTSNSAVSGVTVTGVQGARVDSETRPKNLRVVYIMRVF